MQSRRFTKVVGAVSLLALLSAPAPAAADRTVNAKLDGDREVPVCSTTGSGRFKATISKDETFIEYKLLYDLDGVVSFAHIHLGNRTDIGGVIAFLCGGGGKPSCPASPATVTGTIVAGDVIGPASQGIAAGELAEVIRAVREGLTYANVHSDICPGGEVRGQIK